MEVKNMLENAKQEERIAMLTKEMEVLKEVKKTKKKH